MRSAGLVFVAFLTSCSTRARAAEPASARTLGRYPICETSAARIVPCDSAAQGARCVLVGDNEIGDRLVLFTVSAAGELVDARPVPLHLTTPGVEKIGDIEALETMPDGILVVGSHSRRSWKPKAEKHCQRDDKRLAFAVLTRDASGLHGAVSKTDLTAWAAMLAPPGCTGTLIAIPAADVPAHTLAANVCAAIADADAHAERDPAACSRAFNIEGVVALPGAAGTPPRVWVGLRAPVVGGKAVLLRLHELDRFQFDGVATLDLGGNGVRDLAYARGALWVLAGPMADESVAGTLWRVPADEVTSGAALRPEPVPGIPALPAFSEGLAIDATSGDAFIVVDGDVGDKGNASPTARCAEDAQQMMLHLMPAAPNTPAIAR